MPYILAERRSAVEAGDVQNVGELNITRLLINYMRTHNNYAGINDVMGALSCAGAEFYRRWAAPYEDYKISQNGDVYPTGG